MVNYQVLRGSANLPGISGKTLYFQASKLRLDLDGELQGAPQLCRPAGHSFMTGQP